MLPVYPSSLNFLDKEIILAKVRIMSKITSKLQVTLPKALAERMRLRPGDELEWQQAGDSLRVLPRGSPPLNLEARLHRFDEATRRQRRREAGQGPTKAMRGRGWSREELYRRGRAD